MVLSNEFLNNVNPSVVEKVPNTVFELPEKVLQFGTGVLLRGLPDYFIDKANKQGIFNGRIVVVKSTSGGDLTAFEKQDGLYTLCIRGIENNEPVSKNIICAAISRVLSAKEQWEDILSCAENPDMQVVISNTTEVGIVLTNDNMHATPPNSFPGKLLAFLYKRYKFFNGDVQKGMVIVPTELISDNGDKLLSIMLELAHQNGLEISFIDWLENANQFCNSLVDRIVPGKPDENTQMELQAELGYTDDLITMSEVYSLWAIQGNDAVKKVLSFAQAESGVVVAEDIHLFKELKLRLLNGTHSLSCAIAFLSGITTVTEGMENEFLAGFVKEVMQNEIAKAIPYPVPLDDAILFSEKVLDRFRNKSIEHLWINISLNYTAKLEMRIVAVLQKYVELFGKVPEKIALGFAAYIVFMKAIKQEGANYYGQLNETEYLINDPQVAYFYQQWSKYETAEVVNNILSNQAFWKTDLTSLTGFVENVTDKVNNILQNGMKAVLENAGLVIA
jgi:tagaturonate reductase